MIYIADHRGSIHSVITAHMVGYRDTLDAEGQLYVMTEQKVDPDAHWIEAAPDGPRLVERLPPLVSTDPPHIQIGGSWSIPMVPAGAVVVVDGVQTTFEADEPLEIAPASPGAYSVAIDHPAYMPSRFTLTVTP